MSTDAQKLRVLIPTTNGPVDVLLLTEEDSAVGRCVACIGGTTEIADIAAAYHAFVVRPTGIIESLFGHSCYRLDVSGRIDAGSSWQVGVLAAHALHAAGRLAEENCPADGVVWATGSVRPVDLTVGGVSHVPEKFANSMDRLKQEAAAGRRILLAVPDQNAANLPASIRSEISALGAQLIELSHAQALCNALAVKLPEGPQRLVKMTALPRVHVSAPSRWRYIWGATAVALLCIASALVYLAQSPATVVKVERPPVVSSPQTEPQSEAKRLVPELVPFISDRDRARIRDLYMSAPDYKALAIGGDYSSFITSRPDQATANRDAVATCEKGANDRRARLKLATNVTCDLYASGTVVVNSRAHPPMPAAPWFTRDPSIERPFVAADIPLARAGSKQQTDYLAVPKFKALALAPTGNFSFYSNVSNHEEASRRALERCGYLGGLACVVIALDDTFVVPIPTLAKVVGLYQSDALTAVAPALKDDVARRLKNAASGWKAVAVGASGQVGIKLGAESEQAAVDGSLEACRGQDRDCRLVVIGPFVVQRVP